MTSTNSSLQPTAEQTRHTEAVVLWYLARHHDNPFNPGFPAMYEDPARVGPLAVSVDRLRDGDGDALYRALVATVMFQAMRDVLVRRILCRLAPADAVELTRPATLIAMADATPCDHIKSSEALTACTLAKHPVTKRGICETHPELSCHLKRHTEILGRYGHFGKFPTSLARRLHEVGVDDLAGLYALSQRGRDRTQAAHWIRDVLMRVWRISDKISAMYLSLVSNPDVLPGAPWSDGLDWQQFVVIDTNVDQYLRLIGYEGAWTYSARQAMIESLARRIRVDELDSRLHRYNPRIVQQAVFLFMSASNRRDSPADCSHEAPHTCAVCPRALRRMCSLESGQERPRRGRMAASRHDAPGERSA